MVPYRSQLLLLFSLEVSSKKIQLQESNNLRSIGRRFFPDDLTLILIGDVLLHLFFDHEPTWKHSSFIAKYFKQIRLRVCYENP